MTRLTDHDLFQLAAPLRQVEPVTRPAGALNDASEANAGWTRRFFIVLVAATATVAVVFILALAAHSRSSAPQPAKRTFPAPPACAIAAGGSGVDCGPASAAIRTAGSWQVIDQGRCVDRTRLYFGVHTTGGDAPLSLMLNVPPRALAKGGDVRVTRGQLALASGAKESLLGQAVITPGATGGAFTAHGQDAQGKPDGTTYAGAWTCRAGHTSQQVKQQTRQAGLVPRWTWLIITCHAQLRLARPLADDLRLPWERPAAPGRLTPARVRRGFRNIRATLPCPAGAPKPGKPGPGRPPGSTNRRPAPHHDVGKTTRREPSLKAQHEHAG